MVTTSTEGEKGKHSSCNSDQPCRLPEDLLYEVFVRLPVKSLTRFRCLSKGMYGMIDSSNFVKNHNNHRFVANQRDRSLLDDDYAILLCQARCLFSVYFDKKKKQQHNHELNRGKAIIDRLINMLKRMKEDKKKQHNNNNKLNRAKAIELNCPFVKEGPMFPVGRCCNGVFLFQNRHPDPTSYVLWNPSNGTFREVDCSSCLKASNVSLGYDYVNHDYKIVGFINMNGQTGVQIYSFRSDSWRKFTWDFPPPGRHSFESGFCVGGVMHWKWITHIGESISIDSIAAFDLATEAFKLLPLPVEATQVNLRCRFTDYGGRLCVFFHPSDGAVAQTCWVMERYGVETCWIKVHNFDPFYFPNSERRLINGYVSELSWWDPVDDTYERIEITGPPSYDGSFSWAPVYIYVRNLVRLDHS